MLPTWERPAFSAAGSTSKAKAQQTIIAGSYLNRWHYFDPKLEYSQFAEVTIILAIYSISYFL